MRPRRPMLALWIACALWLVIARCAAAGGFETVASLVQTDGSRFAVFVTGTDALHVVDDVGGRKYDAKIPDTCAPPVRLMDAGGGQALVNCGLANQATYSGTPLLLDLASGAWHAPAGAAALLERIRSGDDGASFSRVGARWLFGVESGYHSYGSLMLDWRSGATATVGNASVMPDPDATDPNVPLCHPLRRAPTPGYPESTDGPPFVDFPYDPPYALLGRELRRCGVVRGLSLVPRGAEASAQLSAGYLTWLAGGALYSYQPACNLLAKLWVEKQVISAAHTRRFVYETLPGDGTVGAPYRVMAVGPPICPSVLNGVVAESRGARRSAVLLREPSWSPTLEILPAPRSQPAPLALAAGSVVVLRTDAKVRALRWRLGAGVWHAATGGAGRWAFRTPALSASTRLTVAVRQGITAARYALPVRSRR